MMPQETKNFWQPKPMHEETGLVMRQVPHGDRGQVLKVLFQNNGLRSVYLRKKSTKMRFNTESVGAVLVPSITNFDLKIKSLDAMPNVNYLSVVAGFLSLGTNPIQWGRASYLLEVTEQMLPPAHPEPAIYELLADALALLAKDQGDGALLRAFELRFLRNQGLLADLPQWVEPSFLEDAKRLLNSPLNDLPALTREVQKKLARPFLEQRRVLGLKPAQSVQFLKQFQVTSVR